MYLHVCMRVRMHAPKGCKLSGMGCAGGRLGLQRSNLWLSSRGWQHDFLTRLESVYFQHDDVATRSRWPLECGWIDVLSSYLTQLLSGVHWLDNCAKCLFARPSEQNICAKLFTCKVIEWSKVFDGYWGGYARPTNPPCAEHEITWAQEDMVHVLWS